MGLLVPVNKKDDIIYVDIPLEILPDEYKVPKPTKLLTERIIETTTYVYGGVGPKPNEGLDEAISLVKQTPSRYRVGIGMPTRWVREYGYPADLRLFEIYDIKSGKWIHVKEEPILRLVPWHKEAWRAQVPAPIARKYNMYAFPEEHPLFTKYAMPVRLKYKYYTTVLRPGRPRIYHVGNYYMPIWEEARWRWRIPKSIDCYKPLSTAFDMHIAPEAQCFFEDDTVYIDFIFSPWGAKAISRRLGYAYRNMIVRSYTLKEEESSWRTEQCDIEIRATFVTPCPIEYYQDKKHMKIVSEIGEEEALGITCWNILVYFGRRELEKSSLELMAYSPKMKETVSGEKNKLVDYAEVAGDRFFYVNKYVRIDVTSRGKKRRYEYHTETIDKRIVESGGIVDEKGFVWSG